MRVLALLTLMAGLFSSQLPAQSDMLRLQPASAAAAGVSTGMLDALTLETDQPTILEFSASWCGPCKEMKPQVDELVRKKYPVRVLDTDEHADLRQNYRVSKVPTFVIVDPEGKEIGRSEGVQQASELASKFRVIKTNWLESRKNQAEVAVEEVLANDEEPKAGSRAARKFGQPGETIDAEHENDHAKPWQTVVRIVVHGGGVMGFGSGTIISSNAQESLILTCAHIFKIEGSRQQYGPKQFPRQVTVDLFDGVLRGQGLKTATRGIPARVIDYDFQSDVGLIAIAPGYTLPASPVVPANWKPTTNMKMITAGCSGGRDATLWNTNVVTPESKLLLNKQPYEAIECLHEPTQGRSGGGLFTLDHYVAGVC
ncbi:MAG: thioredoxin domain-containing protein, partial [Isosphaeraceae bacterium]